jgi:hypothetical protein
VPSVNRHRRGLTLQATSGKVHSEVACHQTSVPIKVEALLLPR